MGDVMIRKAREEDLDTVVALWQEMMRFHADRDAFFEIADDGPASFRKWAGECSQRDDARLFVCERDGELIGYCLGVKALYPPVFKLREYGSLFDLGVTARHRRTGAGAALVAAMCEWFRGQGLTRVELRVLLANEISTKFWRKAGFRPYMETMHRAI